MIIDASRWEREPTPWMTQAACVGTDPDLWFPDRGKNDQALAICGQCLVSAECLAYAVRWDIQFGIWGGHTERQRRKLAAGRSRPNRILPPHGTTARYAKNCRCDDCTEAQRRDAYFRKHPTLYDNPDVTRVDNIRPGSRYL